MFKYNNHESTKAEIKKFLIDQGFTAKEVAEKMGVKPQQYNNIVNKRNFALSDLNRIANAIDCDLFIDLVPKNKE